jgi:hypothetical protein
MATIRFRTRAQERALRLASTSCRRADPERHHDRQGLDQSHGEPPGVRVIRGSHRAALESGANRALRAARGDAIEGAGVRRVQIAPSRSPDAVAHDHLDRHQVEAVGGDRAPMRNLPVVAEGITGTVLGTDPLGALVANERRRRRAETARRADVKQVGAVR